MPLSLATIALVVLVLLNVYIIGAILSWWTFLGVPVSMGRVR